MQDYIFKSERLGFRTWTESDLDKMASINASKVVMQFFPDVQSKEHTLGFINKMNEEFDERKYCIFLLRS